MKVASLNGVLLCAVLAGCVSEETYLKTQSELEKTRKALGQRAAAFETLKNQTGKEKQESTAAFEQEKQQFEQAREAAQASLTKLQQDLDSFKSNYEQERSRRQSLEVEIHTLQDARALQIENETLQGDRQKLDAERQHLEQLLASSQQVIVNGNKALDDANRRGAALLKEKDRLTAGLAEARSQTLSLENTLAAEQAAATEHRQRAEEETAQLRHEHEQAQQRSTHLKQERDRLQAKSEATQRQLQASQQEALAARQALEEAAARRAALEADKAHLAAALADAQKLAGDMETKLQADQAQEAALRHNLETQVGAIQGEQAQLQQQSLGLKEERDRLSMQHDDLSRQLQAAQVEIATGRKAFRKALDDVNARLPGMSKEKERVTLALSEAQAREKTVESKLAGEHVKVTALTEQMETLTKARSKAQEEIARLEKQVAHLESEKARADDLARHLSERHQEIGALRQVASDRQVLAGRVSTQADQLEEANRRIAELTDRTIVAEDERERLALLVQQQQSTLSQAESEIARLRDVQSTLQVALLQQEDALKTEEGEKARLEAERTAKDQAEIQRLGKMHEEMATSLHGEISKGDVTVGRADNRLIITLADRALFDGGQARLKGDGMKILKRISETLKTVRDRHIRVDGHTDDVPISPKFRGRFQSNWELSTARATSVVRALIEQGVDREHLSTAAYADTRPIARNDSEEGRAMNRRIEIVVSFTEPTVLASDTHAATEGPSASGQ